MKSVTILPESDDTTLCLNLTGTVTENDFVHYYEDEIKKRIDAHGYFKMLVRYDTNFKGWEPAAAEKNFKAIIQLGSKPRKLAYVNPRQAKIFLMKLMQPLVKGKIRYFNEDEFDIALIWVKE